VGGGGGGGANGTFCSCGKNNTEGCVLSGTVVISNRQPPKLFHQLRRPSLPLLWGLARLEIVNIVSVISFIRQGGRGVSVQPLLLKNMRRYFSVRWCVSNEN
jgi:hypothetical protein